MIKTDPPNLEKNDSKYFNHVKNIANKILQSPFDLIKLNGVKGSCKTSIMKYVEENNFYSLMFTKKPSDFDFFTTILKMVYILSRSSCATRLSVCNVYLDVFSRPWQSWISSNTLTSNMTGFTSSQAVRMSSPLMSFKKS